MRRQMSLLLMSLIIATTLISAHDVQAGRVAAPLVSLHLCMSFPFRVAAYADLANGVRRGVQLANGQWKSRMRSAGIALDAPRVLDDARPDGVDYGTNQERQNALNCIADSHAIAYIGTLNSGATAVSEPILNNAGMLMISPSNTNPSLTDPGPALRSAHEPATFHHRLKYLTYYRTVTTDSLQGPAAAAFLSKKLGVNSYVLVDDKQSYGASLANLFDSYAQNTLRMVKLGIGHVDPTSAASITISADAVADLTVRSHAQAVYYGGNPPEGGPLLRRLRAKGFTGPFIGGDALFNRSFITDNGSATHDTFTTSVGPDPSQSTGVFTSAYRQAFPGNAPGPYDALAYDAASVALDALYAAASHHTAQGSIGQMRRSLLPYVAKTHLIGATGPVAFDQNGDTRNPIIAVYASDTHTWSYSADARLGDLLPWVSIDSVSTTGTDGQPRQAFSLGQTLHVAMLLTPHNISGQVPANVTQSYEYGFPVGGHTRWIKGAKPYHSSVTVGDGQSPAIIPFRLRPTSGSRYTKVRIADTLTLNGFAQQVTTTIRVTP